MEPITATRENFTITTDKNKIDLVAVHDFLCNESYWCKNIPIETVKKSIEHSLNFGVFDMGKQIGYARVISDYATIAYLGDVYILPAYRGKGLSKWLMEQITTHPELQGLRRWVLLTADAHDLYRQYGWTDIPRPDRYMERFNPNVYAAPTSTQK